MHLGIFFLSSNSKVYLLVTLSVKRFTENTPWLTMLIDDRSVSLAKDIFCSQCFTKSRGKSLMQLGIYSEYF